MKRTLLFFGAALLLCSCNTYQYITVSSPDMKQNEQHQFVAENDTIRLTYNFNGRNGPVQVTVFNKLSKPLLVDLNRSALIINDKAVAFNNNQMEINGYVNGSSIQWTRGVSTSSGNIHATATLPAGVMFIPAGSFIAQSTLVITDKNFEDIPDDQFRKERYTADDMTEHRIKTADFTKEASPLSFRTYLTLMTDDDDRKEFVQQHSFYISQVKQTLAGPGTIDFSNAGDQFYVSKPNSGTQAAVGAAVVTALVVGAAAAHGSGGNDGK
jgi:hypothetical protein